MAQRKEWIWGKNRLYAVRWTKVLDATHWPGRHNPYYDDVVVGPARLSDFVEGARIHCVKDLDPKAGGLQQEKAPAPAQVGPAFAVSEATSETGGILLPEVVTTYPGEV